MNSSLFVLESHDSRVTLAPGTGGAIAGWEHRGLPMLRPSTQQALASGAANALACYPLVPYSNRIAHGRFSFAGESFELTRNFHDGTGSLHPHSIHGIGWQRPWRVAARGPDFATLDLGHQPLDRIDRDWPFAFHAEQRFSLTEAGLTVTLKLENRDERPMPGGFGLHPFFPLGRDTQLAFHADGVWLNGPDHLPSTRELVPKRWRFDISRPVVSETYGAPDLDNIFAGWDGRARIVWPDKRRALAIEADPLFSYLVVFTPNRADYFCVEPVTHLTDGLNRMNAVSDHGVAVLAPGQALEASVRFIAVAA